MSVTSTSKVNKFDHPYDLRIKPQMRSILHKYGAEGYGVAMMLLEILTGNDDNVVMIHENNKESLIFDVCCKSEEQFDEYLKYFEKVNLITREDEMDYVFISSTPLSEMRSSQLLKRYSSVKRVTDYREKNLIIKAKHSSPVQKEKWLKAVESRKKGMRSALKLRADMTVDIQKRILKRFPEIEPLKAIYYFIEKVIVSESEYDYYYKEMTKSNFERFFISWLKIFIQDGIPTEIRIRV